MSAGRDGHSRRQLAPWVLGTLLVGAVPGTAQQPVFRAATTVRPEIDRIALAAADARTTIHIVDARGLDLGSQRGTTLSPDGAPAGALATLAVDPIESGITSVAAATGGRVIRSTTGSRACSASWPTRPGGGTSSSTGRSVQRRPSSGVASRYV